MFKMLVPVAVLAAGLSIAPVRANAHPVQDRAALARVTTASGKTTVHRPVAASPTFKAVKPATVATKPASRPTVKHAAKGTGDITGSIHRSETCKVGMVDLFDRNGNYAKTEKMRVCR